MSSPGTLLKAQGLHPKKQMGQNFLSDPSTAKMIIARSGITPEAVILEIGAGLGALTIPLGKISSRVYAIEKDTQLLEILKSELALNRIDHVELLNRDILKVDIPAIALSTGRPLVVFGNLPYNISSQVLVQLITARKHLTRCFLMFQKELAQRLVALPGNRDYGRLSVMLQYCAAIRPLATINANLFYPKPKIDSEIIEIDFTRAPGFSVQDEAFLFLVIKAAFSKRRKTLKNSMSKSVLKMDTNLLIQGLETAAIDPVRRAETLSVEEFVRLADCLYKLKF
ncbi:MAG: 16S rRNA (adenine(1518)-N(6)/adenine(1519)-N(6))-dimethyltransferase RsmA [Desulfobacterales bacterium]|jgi:16S rRNA (adenine1518-N6/adenine1519-N6)-dimethyltransferase|nr:16S rRNA (adenine(1518)-N(6)/adenine(1519)-N(6))-dimethyltransferase RsmA [Desulfobacterales bacterium]